MSDAMPADNQWYLVPPDTAAGMLIPEGTDVPLALAATAAAVADLSVDSLGAATAASAAHSGATRLSLDAPAGEVVNTPDDGVQQAILSGALVMVARSRPYGPPEIFVGTPDEVTAHCGGEPQRFDPLPSDGLAAGEEGIEQPSPPLP